MVGPRCALIFKIMKQSHLLLVKYLNHHAVTDSYKKNSVTIVVINYLNKTQFFSLIMKIKSLKSKVLSLKIHGKTLLKEF